MKKNVARCCSNCKINIPADSEFIEFKGNFFHPRENICISNLKVEVEMLRLALSEIGGKVDAPLSDWR